MTNTFHISRPLCVTIVAVLLLFSYSLFLKGFFPIKQGLKGFSQKDEAPNIPGIEDDSIPPAKYQRFVLVVIDALRDDFVFGPLAHHQMPYLYTLMSKGKAISFHAKVHPPTVTLPRIKALTTGGIPGFVDVVLNFGSSSLEEDNIVTQFHKHNKNIVFYGDDTWLKLFPDHFLRTDGTTSFFVTDYTEVDTNVSRHLPDELSRYDWDVMILHYLGLDHIGHLAGPRSPLVPPKLLEMDSVIFQIYKAMKLWESESGENGVLMVCGDHGMSDQGGHGGATPGETTVPVIFISPSIQSSGASDNDIMQIDVTPTLASLFGMPIPKNNLGEIVSEALIGYDIEERVRMMQLNCHQVANLLESNVADIEKESGYQLYQQTLKRHSHWLQERNVSSESRQLIGQRILKDYGKAVRDMRSRVSETSTTYDLYTMGTGIVLLWMILLVLIYLSRTESDILVTPNRYQVTLLCCLPFLLGHMTVCTSQFRSEFLCTSNVFLVILQMAVLFIVVMATLFAVMHFKNQSSTKKSKVSIKSGLEGVFVGGCLLHTFSLLSSSFVEEEHQTWYFFLPTIHLFLIYHLIGRISPRQSQTDQSKYALKNDLPVDQSDGSGLYKQRPERKDVIEQTEKTKGRHDLSKGSVMMSVMAILVVLIVCRILRRWNQTGDKWITLPDVGDWLVRPGNKRTLSVTVVASMLCVCVTRWRSGSITQSLLLVLAMVTTYCFRAANGAVEFPAVYHGTSKGLVEARCSYCLIAVYCLLTGRHWWIEQKIESKAHLLWENIQSAWVMLMMLLLRPHNSAFVAMTRFTEYLVSSHIIHIVNLRPVYLTLYCVWFGQASFFFQGNSNSLTTVDVSAGYVGLDSYYPVFIGFLMWASTNGGPVFWMISLAKYLSTGSSGKGIANRISEDHVTAAITLLMCRALPLAVYSVLVTIERYHLFVWTVFSPKLLYEGNSLLVTCLFVFIHLLCANHWRRSKSHHSKSY